MVIINTNNQPMQKIIITTQITKKGYTTTVNYKGKDYTEEWKRNRTGAICVKPFPDGLPEDLTENINDPYNLMDLQNDGVI